MIPKMRALLLASAATMVLAGPAHPLEGVVASIKPLHSMVAAVMDGVSEPTLIVRSTGSEHVYSLRPSDARAIEQANVIFWIGPQMETFLDDTIDTLGGNATVVAMENTPGIEKLAFREGGPFEAHSHGDGEAGDGHDHGHDHGHAHGEHDLHIWLDPVNAKAMVAQIEKTLSTADPSNAERYKANAEAYAGQLDELVTEIETTLAPAKDRPSIVFHDAYQYFERRFGLNVAGSITVSPEVMPGAQRVAVIKSKVQELSAVCVFAEPQFEPKLVSVVTEGTEARTGVLDPLGADIEDGPELYPQLLRNMATSFATCLADPS